MIRLRRRRPALRPWFEGLDDRCLLSGLTPTQVTHAYGLDALRFTDTSGVTVKGDGTGQTIALVEAYHSATLAADLHVFDQAYGLADPALSVINLAGTASDSGWADETALDVEWAHAIAPGANILVVEAKSESVDDLIAAVDVARHAPGVSVVSMSWGTSEFAGETLYDGHFTTPAGHQGVTFVASSGDGGSTSGAEWPAASPNVLSVGGTTLTLDASGGIASETYWADGGGGYSRYEPEPTYQATIQSTGRRSTPDVAFVADPGTGVSIYSTASTSGARGGYAASWQTVGGTSLGAPAWAAIVAIVDQGLSLAGTASLDGATQTIPALYALAAASSSDFNVVGTTSTTGSGSGGLGGGWGGWHPPIFPPFGFGFFTATSGSGSGSAASATTTVGLGSPNGVNLVAGLVVTQSSASTVTTTGGTTPPTDSGSSSDSGDTGAGTQDPGSGDSGQTAKKRHGHQKQKRHAAKVRQAAARKRARARVHALAARDAALEALAS